MEAVKFYKAFDEIAQDRVNLESYDIKKMIGNFNEYRLRLGKYRALFRIADNELLILVIDIGSRGPIYKK